MARRIDTVEARSKLPARHAPYWVKLESGVQLGYRKLAAGAAGSWQVRIYDAASGTRIQRTLGAFEHLAAHERYTAAKREAESLAQHVGKGGRVKAQSVAQVCADYVEHLRAEGRHSAADDVQDRFNRWVKGSKLADLDVLKLNPAHVRTWRQSLIRKPVTVNPHAPDAKRQTRERSPATVNRDMAALRAALNFAYQSGVVTTDAAWRMPLAPMAGATGRRTAYLDRAQRAALIAAAPADVATFLRGLALIPLRPGALAALTVANLDTRLGLLTIGKDKAGANRTIKLPSSTASFLGELCKNKLPAAPLFARADGSAWTKDVWKKPVKLAAQKAGLSHEVTAYTLRHSVITDLIGEGLDVLTVARLSGTSLQMIEAHYGHLRGDQAAAALDRLAL